MTTKKTKLMAGLMAALMVVSMLAAYALPAVAEVSDWTPEENWIPVKTMTDFSNLAVGDYYVADLADLNTLATIRADGYTNGEMLPYGATIHLNPNAEYNVTANDAANAMYAKHQWKASINGHGATIKGVTVAARDNYPAWLGYLGYGNGGSGKTITIENLLMDGWKNSDGAFKALLVWQNYDSNLLLSNITAINCAATNSKNTNGFGLLIGAVTGRNTEVTFRNIRIENSTLNRGSGDNAGFLVGSFGTWDNPSEILNVDGVYLINNTITGTATSQKTGRGIVFGEVTGSGSIKNVAVLNTTASKEADVVTDSLGIVVGGTKNNVSTLTVENVMAFNNGESFTRIAHATDGNAKLSVNKVYSDASYLVSGSITNVSNATPYTEAQIKSGKAAYDANAAITADTAATGLKKWEMAPGAAYPSIDTDGAGLPVAVTLKVGDNETTLYTNANGNLIGLTAAHTAGVNWENDTVVSATAVYTQDVTITGTVDPSVAVLNNLLAYFEGKDAKYFESATYAGSLDALIAEIKANMSGYSAAEYQAKAAALGSFGYKSYPNIPSASEYETYSDSLHFIVNNIDDLNEVAKIKDKFTYGQTIHLAENVVITVGATDEANDMSGLKASINGHNSTIKGVTVDGETKNYSGWLGGNCGDIENLVIDSWTGINPGWQGSLLVGGIWKTAEKNEWTFKNIKMINCVATKSAGSNGMAILLGIMYGGETAATVNLSNITIDGCTMNRVNGNGNSAFVVGVVQNDAKLNIDGAYLIGNTLNGKVMYNETILSSGQGIVIGEMVGQANISNVAVYNTTLGTDATLAGVLAGEFKGAGVMTAKNVVVCNSTDKNIINGANTPTTANIYTDAALIASGEAAYTMNKSSATVKWEMAEGAAYPSFDTNEKGLPVQLTYQVEGSTVATLYTDAAGKPIGNVEDPSKENHIFKGWENSAESYEIDTVLNAILTAIELGDLNANGSVDLTDVILLLQHLVGYDVEFLSSADINGDGRVSVYDAVCLLKKV